MKTALSIRLISALNYCLPTQEQGGIYSGNPRLQNECKRDLHKLSKTATNVDHGENSKQSAWESSVYPIKMRETLPW
jgi:hypothetical protein